MWCHIWISVLPFLLVHVYCNCNFIDAASSCWYMMYSVWGKLRSMLYRRSGNFVVKVFSWFVQTTKIKNTKYILQRIKTSTKNSNTCIERSAAGCLEWRQMALLRYLQSRDSPDTFLGKCPMIVPSFFTATAYRSAAFQGSRSHARISPTAIF